MNNANYLHHRYLKDENLRDLIFFGILYRLLAELFCCMKYYNSGLINLCMYCSLDLVLKTNATSIFLASITSRLCLV